VITWLARAWARLRGRRYGEAIVTATGRQFWPLDPRPEDVDLADVARGLANRCRYNGQIGHGTGYQFYSVAEHSVIVSQYVERRALVRGVDPLVARRWARLALLHDGSEAYIADVARPLKYSREMRAYLRIEARVQRAVFEAFGLAESPSAHAAIKEVDDRILCDEMLAFMHVPEDRAVRRGPPLECAIAGLSPDQAERVFARRFEELF
jgi:uncharacterized protein